MKKINWRRVRIITLWTLIAGAFIASAGFTEQRRIAMTCSGVVIQVTDSLGNSFVEKNDIEELIHNKFGELQGKALGSINISLLESIINSNPFVRNAEVFSTIDGKVFVKVRQRTPVVRIINAAGESYYLDETGAMMPLSEKYTARVIVANGNIFDKPEVRRIRILTEQMAEDTALHATTLEKVFLIASYISKHEYWEDRIGQIYINSANEAELIPESGNHTILFGDAAGMEGKFAKLYMLYKEAGGDGSLQKYSTINLKFKNQVVGTKR